MLDYVLIAGALAVLGRLLYAIHRAKEDRWTVYCRLSVQNMLSLEAIDELNDRKVFVKHCMARFFGIEPVRVYSRWVQTIIKGSTTRINLWS